MAVGELRLTLVAGQRDLVGVDDDDEVARIHMGCEDRLVLPPQELGSLGSEPAEDDIRCVDDVPGTLDIAGLRGERTHSCLLLSWWCQVGRTPSGHGSNGPWARFLRVKAWPLWLYPARSADHATAGLDVGEIPIAPHRERTAAESGTHRGTTTAHPTGRAEGASTQDGAGECDLRPVSRRPARARRRVLARGRSRPSAHSATATSSTGSGARRVRVRAAQAASSSSGG